MRRLRSPSLHASESSSATLPSCAGESGNPEIEELKTLTKTLGGTERLYRRRAAALTTQKKDDTPNSARAAGHGGSSNTMMRLYTDEAPGLKV